MRNARLKAEARTRQLEMGDPIVAPGVVLRRDTRADRERNEAVSQAADHEDQNEPL